MKTKNENPLAGLLSPFSRNLRFPDPKDWDKDLLKLIDAKPGWQADLGLLIGKVIHGATGSQIWVSEEVSNDMIHSTIDNPDFQTLIWPASSLEFVFEDTRLPSFLLIRIIDPDYQEARTAVLRSKFIGYEGSIVPPGPTTSDVVLIADRPDAQAISALSYDEFNQYACGEIPTGLAPGPLTNNDNLANIAMQQMALLAYKVLLFASVPRFVPRLATGPVTKAQGGKPGFQNRPKTPRLIVEYLPHQIIEHQKAADEARSKRDFRGRHGCLRTYRHECYVNRRWTTDVMPPIYAADGTLPKRTFRVVRPPTPETGPAGT